MPKRRRDARGPDSFFLRAARVPMRRSEWICTGVAAALALALLVPFFVRGPREALLYLSMPVWSVLECAKPAAAPIKTPEPKRAEKPVLVAVEQGDPPAVEAAANAASPAPNILIYHTHATEAYLQTEEESYTPSGSWRTEEAEKSVVAVGARLGELLRSKYGFGVIHDTQNFEPPKLASAYGRSLIAMQAYRAQYPSIHIFIDVHRDAFGSGKKLEEPQDFLELDGKQVARLMFVVGTGEGATGTGFAEKPDFESNLALAQAVTERLRTVDGRLARDVRVKTGRYNQHVSSACLLVEVGHNANTLTQALNAVPYLAEAIAVCVEASAAPPQLTAMSVWSP